MRVKKSILIIFTLIVMILPMMTIQSQASILGKVYDFESKMQGNIVYFSWSKVIGADGYDLYINTSNKGYKYIGSVSTTNVSVIGFQENETYTAKVCAYEIKSNGTKKVGNFSSAIEVSTTPETVLGKVTELTVTQNDGNVTLNWSKVNYADGYQVFVNIPNFGYMNIGSVSTTNAIITGFEDGKTYEFKVRAYEKLNSSTLSYGEFSPSKSLKINDEKYENSNEVVEEEKEIEKLAKVTGVTIKSIVENKVNISWNKVSDADGYEIYLSKSNGKFKYMDTVYKNSATLSNLDYDTDYRVIIVSYKNTDTGTLYGDDSVAKSFITEEEEINLTQVKDVAVSVEENKAYISWSKVSSADGYEIWLNNSTGAYQYLKDVYTTNTSITNLSYNTTYRVMIVAFKETNSGRKYGEYSAVVKFTAGKEEIKLAKVTNLYAEVVNRNEAKLSWWPVENAEGYEVYLSENGGTYKKVEDLENNYTILYNLEYNTNYKVKVIAYYYKNREKVYSNYYSSVKSFKTEKAITSENNEEVSRVKNVKVSVVRDTATLSWNKISGAVYYEVDLVIPGLGGSEKFISYTNSKTISGLTEKEYSYTARVRAYKWVDGELVAGEYSYVTEFTAK